MPPFNPDASIAAVALGGIPPRLRPESSRARAALLNAFVEAGLAAVRARAGTAAEASAAANTGRKLLATARRRVATLTRPSVAGPLYSRNWTPFLRALHLHAPALLADPQVVGFGVGYRWRGGAPTDERCVNVYVRRKLARSTLRRNGRMLPRFLEIGAARVPLDVVEFGRLQRLHQGGTSIGPTGSGRWGTLGTLALDEMGVVALTAMHVTGVTGSYPPGDGPAMAAPRGGPLLGRLIRGTDVGVDAAKISVEGPAEWSFEIAGVGPVHGWRPLNLEGDIGTTVRMYGAVSGLVAGRIERTAVDLPDDGLENAILVQMPSDFGDSGAALVDNQNLILGLLAGKAPALNGVSVFSPIGPVLARLECDIPSD